jgi:hypothetical protein
VKILGLTNEHRVVIVGAGNMGYALAMTTPDSSPKFSPQLHRHLRFGSTKDWAARWVMVLTVSGVEHLTDFICEKRSRHRDIDRPGGGGGGGARPESAAPEYVPRSNFAPIQLHAREGGT